MEMAQIRDLLTQVQAGARVTTAIGEPVQVGDRIIIPAAEVKYGGGGGGGGGKAAQEEQAEGIGGGGGVGVRIRPMGCWVVGPSGAYWVPALDMNRLVIVAGTVAALIVMTVRAIAARR